MPDQGSVEESVFDQVSQSSFTPYDPEAVQPTSASPAPSTQSGDIGDTSGADDTAGASTAAQDQKEPPPAFDERHREPFTGLIYLGALTDTFTMWGHEFVIRTLTTEDIAEVGLLVKQYEGTLATNAVYQAATLAAALVTIDGKGLPLPVVQGNSGMEQRYKWVARSLFPPVRARLWNKYFSLEQVVDDTVEAMGKVSG